MEGQAAGSIGNGYNLGGSRKTIAENRTPSVTNRISEYTTASAYFITNIITANPTIAIGTPQP